MLGTRARSVIRLDVRGLALARVALGVVVLLDLAVRATDLRAHYTDAGVLPRAIFNSAAWDFSWSWHALQGGAGWEAGLFSLAGVAALGVMLGAWTRVSTVLTWLLLVSLHARNPLLRDGQDDFLRVMFFFACFLDWGRALSVDAWRAKRAQLPAETLVSPGTAGYLAQLAVVYVASAVAKLQSPWWQSGQGVRFSLSLLRYETPLGQLIRVWPTSLLTAMSYAVVAVELLLPLGLLVTGRWQRKVRTALVVTAIALHLSFAVGMKLGLFPWASAAAWLALLPFSGAVERERAERAWGWVTVALALVLVLAMNLRYLVQAVRVPTPVTRAAQVVGLQQYWALFAPPHASVEAMTDGYFQVIGRDASGGEKDLWRQGGPPTSERPRLVSDTFENRRWRHYFANVTWDWVRGSEQQRTVDASRDAYAHLECEAWNGARAGPERITSVRVVYRHHRLDQPESPFGDRTLVAVRCP